MSWRRQYLFEERGAGGDVLDYRGKPFPHEEIELCIAELREAFELSANPPVFEPGASYSRTKEFLMRQAFLALGDLTSIAAGWALNHLVGRLESGIEAAMPPGFAHKDAPQFVQAFNRTNNLAIERAGATYEFGNSEVNRAALVEFLRLFGNYHPLFQQAADALRAAEFGSDHPLLRRSKKIRKGGANQLEVLKLRQEAAGCVEYLWGLGLTKETARQRVANLWGVSPKTLEDWQAESAKWFGKLSTENYFSFEYSFGLRTRRYREAPASESAIGADRIEKIAQLRSDAAIKRLSLRYDEALRKSRRKTRRHQASTECSDRNASQK